MSELVDTFDVVLQGCRPEPISSYLKALAVLRIVAEQKDPNVQGYWQGENFVLRSALSREALISFFQQDWVPTPLAAPWNGGSGFYPKDNTEAADAIVASESSRLNMYASVLTDVRRHIARQGWTERPADDEKLELLQYLRSTMPDQFLAWLDAAVVLGDDKAMFPPLLGTGGNDGRFDFSTNFQQRVVEVLTNGLSPESALFSTPTPSKYKGTLGQFLPSAGERTNPWDFVFLIEGALFLSASASRRLESTSGGTLAFPFHARSAGGSGTSSEGDEEESRNELWLPLWNAAASAREIRRLFSEGRAKVGQGDASRVATTSLDFARAITTLGVDRGIAEFVRIGFYVRNGLAYYATPLGRHRVDEVVGARLLDEVAPWFDRFRSKTKAKNIPSRVLVARRRLEAAMFSAATSGNIAPVLLELGASEAALNSCLSFAEKAGIRPLTAQLSEKWLDQCWKDSTEQRLAASLSRLSIIRTRMMSIERDGTRDKFTTTTSLKTTFRNQSLVANLHGLLLRADLEASQAASQPRNLQRLADLDVVPDVATLCSLTDIADFIDGRTDDSAIEQWLRAFTLIANDPPRCSAVDDLLPTADFAVLSLAHSRVLSSLHPSKLARTPGLVAAACAGRLSAATELAIRRLRTVGASMPFAALTTTANRAKRIAAALAFPLSLHQRQLLEKFVLVLPQSASEPVNNTYMES